MVKPIFCHWWLSPLGKSHGMVSTVSLVLHCLQATRTPRSILPPHCITGHSLGCEGEASGSLQCISSLERWFARYFCRSAHVITPVPFELSLFLWGTPSSWRYRAVSSQLQACSPTPKTSRATEIPMPPLRQLSVLTAVLLCYFGRLSPQPHTTHQPCSCFRSV